MILGSISRTGAVPAFLRTPGMIQPHLDMKPFLQFPLDSAPPPPPHGVGIFHNFSAMDPVQKAVINHTFGIPLVKTKRPVISCNVCQIRFNSESQAEAHYKGNRHARRVKGMETSKTRPQESDKPPPPPTASPTPPGPSPATSDAEPSKQDEAQPLPPLNGLTPAPPPLTSPLTPDAPTLSSCQPQAPPTTPLLPASSSSSTPGCGIARTDQPQPGPPGAPSPAPSPPESEEDKAKKLLYCSLCKVAVNSLSQLEAHNKGTKHKTILEARSGLGPIKAYPRLGPKPSTEQGGGPLDPNTQERTFHCEICNVRVNSELQLKQHISSRRHRDGVAGKPNPLLSRYKKHRATDLTPALSFTKDLPKALGASLLPSPLAVAAAMAAAASSNQLALRAAGPPAHHHLLQAPPLAHALLRPAPGPIRTSHGPVLFSPY
ncbi:zinc finger protein 385A-like isoform X3 [Brienomyrus brachyistius]|uniref:zinc finger protein 385A-like isoform X3 n=1 Tax=Brienomyrus brachyistius TaxID=42636 RepID=UPI0020B3EF06|nr:zinc finger protein 385A-like isoform X3 [Brienomyrus brachyistius]XP_048856363.1 zinc finger protein 385A-like isoform X3 [Brienomyrus brachyistius]